MQHIRAYIEQNAIIRYQYPLAVEQRQREREREHQTDFSLNVRMTIVRCDRPPKNEIAHFKCVNATIRIDIYIFVVDNVIVMN